MKRSNPTEGKSPPASWHDYDADQLVNELSSGIGQFHLWIFLFQACGFGLVFLVLQISQLEHPWYRGPWHYLFLGWLVIYLHYAQFAERWRIVHAAATEATESSLSDQNKLLWWYDRAQFDQYQDQSPWWMTILVWISLPIVVPAAIVFAIVRQIYRVAITPAKWPEAGVLAAAIIAIYVVPTYGPGPLLVTSAHIAAVVWLRNRPIGS